MVLLAALLAVTLTLATRAEAFVYWGAFKVEGGETIARIARANLNGTGVDQRFITGGDPESVAVDAEHIYWTNYPKGNEGTSTIGRANLDGAGVDQSFITDAGSPVGVAADALRSFSLGKVKTNKKEGTAKLTVKVPGPGELELGNTTEVKGAKKRAAKGKVKLPVRAKGETKKKLKRKGKAKVRAEVTYTPTGGDPNVVASTLTKTVKLVKRG
jgi:hypothetical protein